ncbi:Predicted PurR-regulated permease PerM [Paenibacillus sophorae]|uniref:AI-2E family transporter n=1 Tax=Paenibacillus sophorae TaxID=1333845 RepID=A0A1H8RDK5_9BACL|nr:AI-2E family transporter [Paenibacillus sophorae]QWU15037.1 AI-2E family transporter [Paenibacillus sophorae]SEO64083.1 Predicted PurR-regulated permease PerM [Paenibacillus sophorae]
MEQWSGNKWFRWMVGVLLALIILYFVWLLHPMLQHVFTFLKAVLAPFLTAMIISYVLNPVVSMLAGRKVPRGAAVLLIYAVFLTTIAVIAVNLVPMLIKQLEELNEHLPEMTLRAQGLMHSMNTRLIPPGVEMGLNNWFFQLENRLAVGISHFLDHIGTTIGVLFDAFIVPFLVFYILKDFDVFERTLVSCLPRSRRKSIVTMLKDIDEALGNYIRGQFLVSLIIGILAYIGYALIGMPYALLFASLVAIFELVPYLGPFLGAAPAIVMASTISFRLVLLVVVVNTLCQMLESNVISPQVVGRTLHLHPLLIIFALLVGGELAGIVGLILAVPCFAAGKVVLQHVISYYMKRKPV